MKKLMKTANVLAYVEDGADVKAVELCVPYTKTRRKMSNRVKLACDGPVLKYTVKNVNVAQHYMDDAVFIKLAGIMVTDTELRRDILKLVYGEEIELEQDEDIELNNEMEAE